MRRPTKKSKLGRACGSCQRRLIVKGKVDNERARSKVAKGYIW